MAKVYHYTSIDSLAQILKNKSILFNRQDNVDDLEEGLIKPMNIKLATYTFISCWTENEEENIPLWKMYTDNGIGVRIGLEVDMFKDYSSSNGRFEDGFLSGPITTKLPIGEMLNPNYFITPFVRTEDFYKKIEYVSDFTDRTNNLVKIESLPNNEERISVDSQNVARFKHKRWSFEEESRFIINIWPRDSNRSLFKMGDWMYKALMEGIELPFKNYFLYLKDNVFDDLEIRLSPNIPESKRLIIESIRDKYAPKAIIQNSSLDKFVKLK